MWSWPAAYSRYPRVIRDHRTSGMDRLTYRLPLETNHVILDEHTTWFARRGLPEVVHLGEQSLPRVARIERHMVQELCLETSATSCACRACVRSNIATAAVVFYIDSWRVTGAVTVGWQWVHDILCEDMVTPSVGQEHRLYVPSKVECVVRNVNRRGVIVRVDCICHRV